MTALPTVVYLAHPCGAPTLEEHKANLARARRWFKWIADQGFAVSADWLIYCDVWSDFDSAKREEGLRHDDALIVKADEFWLVGGRVSPGMARGRGTAERTGVKIRDYTCWGAEPPALVWGEVEAPSNSNACSATCCTGWICTRTLGHADDWHVAHGRDECHRWPVKKEKS